MKSLWKTQVYQHSPDLDWQPEPDRAEYFKYIPASVTTDFGGAQAAQAAAQAQIQAANKSAQTQLEMFYQGKAGIEPWRLMGLSAMAPYMKMLGMGDITPFISQAMGPKPTWSGAIPTKPTSAKGRQYDIYQQKLSQWQAEKAMFDQMQQGGGGAMSPTDMLRATPGYQFQVEEGQKALERQASARGLALSGPQEKALTTFRQGLADQTYQQYLANLWQTTGSGQQAAAGQGAMGMQAGQGAGNAYMMAGQAAGQGIWNAYQARQSEMGSMLGMGAMGIMGLGMLGLQEGGPASAGTPYVVGEAGPELFVPQQSGMVIPNNALSPYTAATAMPGQLFSDNLALGPFADYYATVPWAA